MIPPLRNDKEVRKAAREAIGGRTEDMEKTLEQIGVHGHNSDVQDVANVGLMALQGVEGGQETTELARRQAGRAALDVLSSEHDPKGSVQGVGRVGEQLTDPSMAFALNLGGAETILQAIQSAAIPGAMGAAIAFTLELGEKLREPGHTATQHSSFTPERPEHTLGPGQSFDFVGVSAVYHAAFSNLVSLDLRPQVGEEMTSVELADLGSSMLLYAGEANGKYPGYLQTPDTPQVIAGEVLARLPETAKASEDTRRWAELGMKLLPDNPQAAGCEIILKAVSDKKPANSVTVLAIGRQALEALPEERRESFAQNVLYQAVSQRQRESEEPIRGAWAALDEVAARVSRNEISASQAVLGGVEQLSQSDPWLMHGTTTPSNAGIAANEHVVLVPGGRLKVRKPPPG